MLPKTLVAFFLELSPPKQQTMKMHPMPALLGITLFPNPVMVGVLSSVVSIAATLLVVFIVLTRSELGELPPLEAVFKPGAKINSTKPNYLHLHTSIFST